MSIVDLTGVKIMSASIRHQVLNGNCTARPSCEICNVTMWDPAFEPLATFAALYSLPKPDARKLRLTLAKDGSDLAICAYCNDRHLVGRSLIASLTARFGGQRYISSTR